MSKERPEDRNDAPPEEAALPGELRGCVLVLVAHPDDDGVGYGLAMQQMSDPRVVIATDGAPLDSFFWQPYGSREAYAELRRQEAQTAAETLGIAPPVFLAQREPKLIDQQLFRNLLPAYRCLCELLEESRPEAIATLAYEGGHPDHDSCSLLAARLGASYGLPVWEAPLYHRGGPASPHSSAPGPHDDMQVQRFLFSTGEELMLASPPAQLERKRNMCAAYGSQQEILRLFDASRELVRPQPQYDYGRPPHAGPLNYEVWQWPMRASEVCAEFQDFLESTG